MNRLMHVVTRINHLPVSEPPNNRTDKLLEMLVINTAIIIDELRKNKKDEENAID